MKLGLALSGGGFRAAFFHLGVLARLAELGLLRQVEVISTVSGGSILGALYYAHLKRLLERAVDPQIRDDDYAQLIARMEGEFSAAVAKNLRMRTFVNPIKTLRMVRANYSRSDRIGELYDRLLYRPALRPGSDLMVQMRELKIFPADSPTSFYPRTDNADRSAKVPILLINATTLNTGHNWRFEASTMGSPARATAPELDADKNLRLLRPNAYADITPDQQDIELGLAVAASACVPGIFHPLALSKLYPDIRVELVDGGVHDNQGIRGLLDEHCTHLIVSDASGQMDDDRNPATRIWAVLSRTNDILMDRVREEQLLDLLTARGLPTAFLHLRKDLPVDTVPFLDRKRRAAGPVPGSRSPRATSFGVDRQVQQLLSSIRTDLDSFTEIEASSLMLDGYLMSEPVLRATPGFAPLLPPASVPLSQRWRFLAVQRWMASPTKRYLTHLRVGREQFFKVFRLSPPVAVLTAAVVLSLAWLLWRWQAPRILAVWNYRLTLGSLVVLALLALLGFVPGVGETIRWFTLLRSPTRWSLRLVIRGVLPALASVFVVIHLVIFNRLFLWLGRVKRLE